MSYKAGIIGTGGVAGLGTIGVHEDSGSRATASHAGGYEMADDVELIAAADVDSQKLEAFCDAWNIAGDQRYADHETMLTETDLDIVSVCTPAVFHHDHTIAAAKAGVDVILCEKPIASSLAEAAEMVDVCERFGSVLVVNHTLRFTKKFQRLKQHMEAESTLGQIQSVSVQSRMELLRNASHVFDLLVFLFDENIETIWGNVTGKNESVDTLSADIEVDDAAGSAMCQFETGISASVDCTLPRNASSISYNFIGTGGKLWVNLDDGEWRYWRLEDGDHVPAEMEGIDEPWTWNRDYEQGFVNMVAHATDFLDDDHQTETISTGQDSMQSLEALVALYVSHYTGARVSLPLEQPLRNIEIRSW